MKLTATKLVLLFCIFLWTQDLEAQNVPKTLLDSIYTSIKSLVEAEDYEKSITSYTQALVHAENKTDSSYIYSESAYLKALLGQFKKSEIDYQLALELALNQQQEDTTFIQEMYYYLAYCSSQREDNNLALEYNKRSLAYDQQINHPLDYALTLSNMATIYFQKSDYDNALEYERQALHLFEREGNKALAAESKNGIALSLFRKRAYQEASTISSEAIREFEEILADSIARETVSAYINYALIAIQLNHLSEAEHYVEKAIALRATSGIRNDLIDFNRAFLLFKKGELKAAKKQFESYIQHINSKSIRLNSNLGKARYYIGEILRLEGINDLALNEFQLAMQELVPSFLPKNVLANPNLKDYCSSDRNLLRILIAKSSVLANEQAHRKDISIETVFNTIDLAIEVADELRRDYRSLGSRLFLAEETKSLYETALDFSSSLYQNSPQEKYLEKLFYYLEKNQKPLLLQNQWLNHSEAIGGVPDSLLKKENELSINLAYFKNKLDQAKANNEPDKINLFSGYVLEYRQKMDALHERLKMEFPSYYKQSYSFEKVDLSSFQKSLKEGDLYIQYFPTDSLIYILSIDQTSKSLLKIANDSINPTALNQLYAAILNPLQQNMSSENSYQQFCEKSHYFYTLLLEPLLSNSSKSYTRLYISASGFLSDLPFELLLQSLPTKAAENYLSLVYLMEDFSISYQPSANLKYRFEKQENQAKQRGIYGFAPFANSELSYTLEELKHLKTSYNATNFYDQKASKSAFLSQASEASIIHIATHGIPNHVDSENAYLQFSEILDSTSDHSRLYNYEIQNQHFSANLAVLSACETGVGKNYPGEGIQSLARAFFYAGVPSVIMSRWQINDRSTNHIMKQFYTRMKEGESKDVALQQSKLNYLNELADSRTAHPFYWAGLTQQGNINSIEIKPKNNLFFLLPLMLILLGGIWFLLSKNKKGGPSSLR